MTAFHEGRVQRMAVVQADPTLKGAGNPIDPPRLKYCVDNVWRESKTKRYMPVTDSSTGKVIAYAPACTAAEVEEAISAAAAAYPSWSSKPVAVRTQLMYKWKPLLEAHMDEIAVITATELGAWAFL